MNDAEIERISRDKNQRIIYAQQLKSQNRSYNRIYRKLFVAFGLIFALAKIYGMANNYYEPYSFSIYGSASGQFTAIAVSEFFSAVGFILVSYFILGKSEKIHNQRRILLIINIIIGAIISLFWIYLEDSNVHWVWFGFGNILFSVICYFANSSMDATEKEVRGFYDWALANENS